MCDLLSLPKWSLQIALQIAQKNLKATFKDSYFDMNLFLE